MKDCPFCGKNKLKIDTKEANKKVYKGAETFYRVTASVRCNCCHSRGPTVSILVNNTGTNVTQNIEILAAKAWNDRK